MKLIKGILGCALAAGLTTFAPVQTHAGTVINGTLYSALNLKLALTFQNESGKVQKKTVTSKQALIDLGYNGKVTLAVAFTNGNPHIYVINTAKNASVPVLEDLTADDVMGIEDLSQIVSTEKDGKNGAGTVTSSGTISIFFDNEEENNDVPSEDFFDASGVYSASLKASAFKKDSDLQNVNTKVTVSALSGAGFFGEIPAVDEGEDNAVITGSATVSGNGSVILDDQGIDF